MREIPIKNKKGKTVAYTKVSDRDYPILHKLPLRLDSDGYVVFTRVLSRNPYKFKSIRVHRMVKGFPEDRLVDHKYGDKLDNRRGSLRVVTISQNSKNQGVAKNNTSGYPGVHYLANQNSYQARIMNNGKRIFLGYFKDFCKAVQARQQAEIKYYGSFAPCRGVLK